jgi:hypothetical protein
MSNQKMQALVDFYIQQAIHLFEQGRLGLAFLKYHQAVTIASASCFVAHLPALSNDFLEAMNDIEDDITNYHEGD